MIKVILFTIIGIFALIVQWLCMTDVNGVRSIKDYRPFSFLFNPFESLTQTTEPAKLGKLDNSIYFFREIGKKVIIFFMKCSCGSNIKIRTI